MINGGSFAGIKPSVMILSDIPNDIECEIFDRNQITSNGELE